MKIATLFFMDNVNQVKKCCKCKLDKPFSEFNKWKYGKYGLMSECKICRRKSKKEAYYKNHEKSLRQNREKHKRNRNKEIISMRAYRQNNLERCREFNRRYYHKNKEIIYQKQQSIEYKLWKRENRKRYMENPQHKIIDRLRSRIYTTVVKESKGKKSNNSIKLIGCSGNFLIKYLESQFLSGMTWENYGFGDDKWHVDHIIPCKAFDLTKPEHQLACMHFSNLTPLWQKDNISKLNKLPPNFNLEEFILFSPGNHSSQVYLSEMW